MSHPTLTSKDTAGIRLMLQRNEGNISKIAKALNTSWDVVYRFVQNDPMLRTERERMISISGRGNRVRQCRDAITRAQEVRRELLQEKKEQRDAAVRQVIARANDRMKEAPADPQPAAPVSPAAIHTTLNEMQNALSRMASAVERLAMNSGAYRDHARAS